ncbi:ATP-binding cassette domain-containing protein [Pedobacter sp. UC225_61]|uniref:ATP-binding cassette domain-containing protein n=1 Tax=Pedobacter sp. UC225_61 TaxID=3374623 RepID=UPI003789973B
MQELYIDSVNHRYGGNEVLSSVYLSCKVGEVVGLLGRNGSGKSTLLKIIFGSIQPKFKHLKIDGEFKLKGYLTHQVSYLPQGYFIPHYLKIKDLIDLYINRYKEQILQLDVFKSNLNEPIGNLSGGNRRLVEALLIVYSDAKYVLLDEPFSQLAPLLANDLKEHIFKLKSEKGFIITDHYYRQIMEVSSRIILLHNGCNYAINNEDDLRLHNYLPK